MTTLNGWMDDSDSMGSIHRTPVQAWEEPQSTTLRVPWGISLNDFLSDPPEGQWSKNRSFKGRYIQFTIPLPSESERGRLVHLKGEIFDDFLGLGHAPDEKIQAFSRKYGPLYAYSDWSVHVGFSVVRESCDLWRYISKTMQALMEIGFCLRARRHAPKECWEIISQPPPEVTAAAEAGDDNASVAPFGLRMSGEVEFAQRVIRFVAKGKDRTAAMWRGLLNSFIVMGDVRPWVVGGKMEASPRLVFTGPKLLSFLALQLCEVALSHEIAICWSCRKPYSPKHRAPKRGQLNFCVECRKSGKPNLFSQRRRRERLRDAKPTPPAPNIRRKHSKPQRPR